MTVVLPDPALNDPTHGLTPLSWVGMEGIDLPITVLEPGYRRQLHARVDAQVDLPLAHVKGIHMSRLYRLLNDVSPEQALSPLGLRRLLQSMVDSQDDCGTRSARLGFSFDLLLRRPALVTQDLAGWKSYPVVLEARLLDGIFVCKVQVQIGYSSTCPCSAALARQLIEQGFMQAFGKQPVLRAEEVAVWLRQNASLATPHSQRSQALVQVQVAEDSEDFGLLTLIDRVEKALATPLQTAVKRADEQAFAALNGQNLMFVEDAARCIEAALVGYQNPGVQVRHLESLHPHDAVAFKTPLSAGMSLSGLKEGVAPCVF
ncbi:GTP cyclohydrolase FolE2 [Alcaligenes faecalis]|uniref:GTP cyclohydrolase FolE2 n=1 Tax=Alcaligenes faecalis TaxID=511 RepID=UPI002933ED2A|nr:GTP cyclohydrolase FolE2 [Alcaligenes faecalis]MDV2116965.1 GTP cyclohydrolase FolE2 [Alcaligenes faecalis]